MLHSYDGDADCCDGPPADAQSRHPSSIAVVAVKVALLATSYVKAATAAVFESSPAALWIAAAVAVCWTTTTTTTTTEPSCCSCKEWYEGNLTGSTFNSYSAARFKEHPTHVDGGFASQDRKHFKILSNLSGCRASCGDLVPGSTKERSHP